MDDTTPEPRTFAAPGVAGELGARPASTIGPEERHAVDDLDRPRPTPERVAAEIATPLDALRDEVTAELAETTTLEIPGRPGYGVRFSLNIDHPMLGLWRKKAKDSQQPEGIDELKWACIILAAQAEAIVRNGDELVLDGEPVTFSSRPLLELLGAREAHQAVRKLYGRDAHIVNTAYVLLELAGYGTRPGELDGSNPTRNSSRS